MYPLALDLARVPVALAGDVTATLLRTPGACGGEVRNITASPGRSSRRLASLAPILSPCQAATERRCSK